MSDNPQSPKWNQVPPLEDYNAARNQRSRPAVRTAEGKTKRVPALPFEYWCKPCGNVVRLVVMTTRNVREAIEPHRYADYARRSAIRNGWFPWSLNDARVYTPNLTFGMDDEKWAKWRDGEQRKRWEEHKQRSAAYTAVWKKDDEHRALQAKEATSAALTEMVELMRADAKKAVK